MAHPGMSAYTSGLCSSNSSYFGGLVRRFNRERVPLRFLAEDILGKPLISGQKVEVNLEILAQKFKMRHSVVKKRQ